MSMAGSNLSLKNRLTLIILGVSAVSIFVGLTISIIFDISWIRDEMRSNTTLNARMIGQYCIAPLIFDYQDEAEEVLQKLAAMPEAVNAFVYRQDGTVLAGYHRTESETVSPPAVRGQTAEFHEGFVDVFHPVEFEGDIYGTVFLRVSAKPLQDKIRQQLVVTALLMLLLVSLAYLMAHSLQKRISGPVLQLAGLASRITEQNDYSLRVESDRADEIGTLYQRFNQLCEQVLRREGERDRAEDELRKHQEHLEELVTERTAELEQVSEKLREALVKAESGSRAKSEFLANMSHEIRTPMNAILGFTQLLKRSSGLTEDQQNNVGIISRSGEHLLALINDILEMSKIEAGRVTVSPSNFDLHRLLRDLETMFMVRTDGKGLRLEMEFAEGLPVHVRADEGKLRQILINLMGNAVKFTSEGGITVTAAHQGRDGSMRLKINVADTGIGISEEDLQRIFTSFEQSTAEARGVDGTGLGLAISRQYARLMGGEITASSRPGHGSLFQLDIPVEETEIRNVEPPEETRQVVGLAPNQPAPRILVADDREDNRLLLTRLLEEVGFDVREVVNGREAVEQFGAWRPRVVLMDIAMPVMDGLEATRLIREMADGREALIIAITASVFEEELEQVELSGTDGVIRKPFRDSELYETIGHLAGIEYVYAEEPESSAGGAEAPACTPAGREEIRERLQALPPDLLSRMLTAVRGGYIDRIAALIDEVRGRDATLANGLHQLAERFEYETLWRLLDTPDD